MAEYLWGRDRCAVEPGLADQTGCPTITSTSTISLSTSKKEVGKDEVAGAGALSAVALTDAGGWLLAGGWLQTTSLTKPRSRLNLPLMTLRHEKQSLVG
jgi:hypothetical protein